MAVLIGEDTIGVAAARRDLPVTPNNPRSAKALRGITGASDWCHRRFEL